MGLVSLHMGHIMGLILRPKYLILGFPIFRPFYPFTIIQRKRGEEKRTLLPAMATTAAAYGCPAAAAAPFAASVSAAARPFLRLARFLLLPQAHGGVSRVRAAAAGFFLPLESSSASFGV